MPDQQYPGPKEKNSLGELGDRISKARHAAGLDKTAEEQDAAAGSALGVAWRISIEIVVALVVCTAIGWALDYWFGTKPWLMLIFLFSLAGIPPTAGFFAKFYILVALVEQGYVGLAVIAVLLSAVAAFFYIRIVMLMYMKEEARPFDLALTPSLRLAIAITAAGTGGIGLRPAWFLDLAQGSVFLGIG